MASALAFHRAWSGADEDFFGVPLSLSQEFQRRATPPSCGLSAWLRIQSASFVSAASSS